MLDIQKRAKFVAEFCAPYLRAGATVLDVGCSTGEMLVQMRDGFGCHVMGIEPSDGHRKYAESVHGLQVFGGALDEFEPGDCKPDLIILSHVLEHFISPRTALARIRQIIADMAVLYVEVPNLFVHKSFRPGHTYTFHKATLAAMLAFTGFDVFKSYVHGYPGQPWIGYSISVLAKPVRHSRPACYTTVMRKRRLGRIVGASPELLTSSRVGLLKLLQRVLGKALYAKLRGYYRRLWRIS
ncbi:class I SAM-dependent methyltransferase [Acidobacteria bacterium AH-259-L09]|nr:class I SAM-dependent methyltransferase [Acidobacteria bacterium AH-259-L09]